MGLWSQGFVRLDHEVRCGVMESEVGSWGKVWGYGVRGRVMG